MVKTQFYLFICKKPFTVTFFGNVVLLLYFCPTPVENVLCIQYPLSHPLDLLDLLSRAFPFSYYCLRRSNFLLDTFPTGSPFFPALRGWPLIHPRLLTLLYLHNRTVTFLSDRARLVLQVHKHRY